MSADRPPWQSSAWTQAWAATSRGAHALLVAGPQGLGKSQFADDLAAALLCARGSEAAGRCGACESCRWLLAGTHPDLVVVEPVTEDEGEGTRASGNTRSKPISVDQIRAMTESLGLTAHREAGKVVIVRPAEALNVAASNALLKALEEPPSNVLFMLVSDRPALLLPTVRSRCQKISMNLADPTTAAAWLRETNSPEPDLNLALSGGAPLLAQRIASDAAWHRRPELLRALMEIDADPIRIAERHRDAVPALVLGWLQRLTYDVTAWQNCRRLRYNLDLRPEIERCAARTDPKRMSRLHRKFISIQRIVNHPLNARLFLEQLFIDFAVSLVASGGRPTRQG